MLYFRWLHSPRTACYFTAGDFLSSMEHLVSGLGLKFHWLLFSPDNENCALKPYAFKMEEIEGFRYRCRVRLPTTLSFTTLSMCRADILSK